MSNSDNNVNGANGTTPAGSTPKPNIQSLLAKLRDKIKTPQQENIKTQVQNEGNTEAAKQKAEELKNRVVVGQKVLDKMESQLQGMETGQVQMLLNKIDAADGNVDGDSSLKGSLDDMKKQQDKINQALEEADD